MPVQVRPGAPSISKKWRVGRVAMQRIANPFTSVRLRDAPPSIEMECDATLAQLVERNLAKVEVTSSNLVCRSKLKNMAEWRYSQMVSYPSQEIACPGGGIGRHKGFKIPRRSRCAGSSPARGTIIKKTSLLTGFFSSEYFLLVF